MGEGTNGGPLKVLLVTPKYPPYMGGAATDYSHLVESLRSYIDFTVLTCAHRDAPLVERLPGARILRILPPFFDSKAPVRFLLVPFAFLGCMLASLPHRPHLIHAHSTTSVGLGALLFGGMTNRPLIKEFTDQGVRKVLVKVRRNALYMARGTTVRDLLAARGVPEDRLRVVHSLNVPTGEALALAPRIAANGGTGDYPCEILFAGSLNCRMKGLDVLLEAFQGLARSNPALHLTLIGDGPDSQRLRTWVRGRDLGDRVTFTGNLSYTEVLQRISQCAFLVLPSRAGEAYPRVIVEAFLFGTPVVATAVGDVPRILAGGKNGILVEPGDLEGLATAMARVASDPELRRTIAAAGHEYLKTLPNWDSFAGQVRALYMAAIGEQQVPRPVPTPNTAPGRG